jgi:integrase
VRRRHNKLSVSLAVLDYGDVYGLAKDMFAPPHCDDDEFIGALAHAYLQFLSNVMADDTAIYNFIDEANGIFVLRKPCPDIAYADARGGPPSVPAVPDLSTLRESYISERGSGLSEERADTIRAVVRDFIAITTDKPITAYGRDDASAFKETMLALPGNWNKRKGLREHGIIEAAARAKALGLPRQGAETIKKKWSILFSLFDYAGRNYDGVQNPFHAKSLVVSDNLAANEQKSPFRSDELKILLESELPGHLRWLTWLGVFTGARLNELAQLSKNLIRQDGSVHYIYFSPELRLKSGEKKSCVRSVPIHSKLIELGFLDYVARCSGDLFPGLPMHKSGRFSDAPSKAFSRHLRKIGVKRPRLSFHSLRHTFSAALKRLSAEWEARQRLLGHAVAGVAGRYGDSYEAEAFDMQLLHMRAELIERLEF